MSKLARMKVPQINCDFYTYLTYLHTIQLTLSKLKDSRTAKKEFKFLSIQESILLTSKFMQATHTHYRGTVKSLQQCL